MADSVDLSSDNFAETPWSYPGSPPPYSGLLHGQSYLELTPKRDRRLGQATIGFGENFRQGSTLNYALLMSNVAAVDSRQLVIAVGSNASPAVMRRKFAKHGVNTTVPFIKATIAGLDIGHSAHVSTPGYIAATPILAPSATTPVVASLLDSEQLDCLDRTEPNYDRRLVTADSCPLVLERGEAPRHFLLYVSKWGVLAPPGQQRLHLTNQDALYDELRKCEPFARLAGEGDAATIMRRFATDDELREQARDAFRLGGWVRDSGFEGHPDGKASARYGSIPSTWRDTVPGAGSLVCVSSSDEVDRLGEQCITLHTEDAAGLGSPSHVAIRATQGPTLAPAPARLIVRDSQPRGTAGVDQVLRNSLGIELQESVVITSIRVKQTPLADAVLSRPHFCMVRVQSADLATVEQNVGLLDPLAMSILGVGDGDEVVIQGAPDAEGNVTDVRMSVHAIPPELLNRRETLAGGTTTARFPSARDALGVHPDLPWLFLDSASRLKLGIGDAKLSVVRVRASRRFQLVREFRELLLLLVFAAIGLAAVVKSTLVLVLLLAAVFLATVAVVRSRLKGRLESAP